MLLTDESIAGWGVINKPLSEEEMLALLSTDGMLVKRPIFVSDDFVLVGFKPEEWSAKLLK